MNDSTQTYIAAYSDEYDSPETALSVGGLHYSNQIIGGYTEIEDALEYMAVPQSALGRKCVLCIVDDNSEPTRYVMAEDCVNARYGQDEFWDNHRDVAKAFAPALKKYEVQYDEIITRRLYIEARDSEEAISIAKDNQEDGDTDKSERVIQGFDNYKPIELDSRAPWDRVQQLVVRRKV
jgi:hypothetical protein